MTETIKTARAIIKEARTRITDAELFLDSFAENPEQPDHLAKFLGAVLQTGRILRGVAGLRPGLLQLRTQAQKTQKAP